MQSASALRKHKKNWAENILRNILIHISWNSASLVGLAQKEKNQLMLPKRWGRRRWVSLRAKKYKYMIHSNSYFIWSLDV